MFALELSNSNDFSQEFDRALQSGIQTPEELFLVYRANIDYRWRQLHFFDAPDAIDISSDGKYIGYYKSALTKTQEVKQFQIALGKAKKYFADNRINELHCVLCIESLKYGAILHKRPVDSEAWQKVLEKYPEQEEPWNNAIQLCMHTPDSLVHGNIEQAREWFKLAFKKIVGWPPKLGDQWRWFERVHGDLESYLYAEWSITRKQTDAMKQYAQTQNQAQQNSRATKPGTERKRKRKNNNEVEPPAKKQKTEQVTLYVNNLPWKKQDRSAMEIETLEEALKAQFGSCGTIVNIRVPKNEKNRIAGFAFIDFASHEHGWCCLLSFLFVNIC